MPSERLEFTGDSIDAVLEQMKEAGAKAVTYNVKLYDGDQVAGMATQPDYNGALLGAAKEAGFGRGVDMYKYTIQISVTAERPSVEIARPAGAGPAQAITARYTNLV